MFLAQLEKDIIKSRKKHEQRTFICVDQIQDCDDFVQYIDN